MRIDQFQTLQVFAVTLLLTPASASVLETPTFETYGQWLKVFDADEWQVTADEANLQAHGWIFQDWDFVGYPQCVDGTRDCTGKREVVFAPYGGTGNAVAIHGSDPEEIDPANARSISAFPLPKPIPLGGSATLYFKFAYEGPLISTHFGLTAETEPSNESAETGPRHDYGSLATHGQVSPATRATLGVFEGFWVDATLDPELILDPEIWYELWYVITNAPTTEGGGYFELYIRGGAFGDGEPYHLANPYAGSGITEWNFRQLIDQPLARFVNIHNSGNPTEAPPRSDAIYFDDMYLLLHESPDTDVSLWNSFPDHSGWKPGGIGWLYDGFYPWIYHGTAGWLYILPEGASLDSFFAYGDEAGSWLWSADNFGGWYYDYGTSDWATF